MAYVEQADIEADLPAGFLVQALDDDGDGEADSGAWDKVAVAVGNDIDGALGQKFAVPIPEPFPAVVKASARILALWHLYQRRGFHGDANPWETEAKRVRDKLDKIGSGKEPLTPDNLGKMPGGFVVTEPAKTFDKSGSLMA